MAGLASPLLGEEAAATEVVAPLADSQPSEGTAPTAAAPATSLFVGYESEPAMDYGGRVVASANLLLARTFGRIGDVGERHPGLAPVWEFPLGAVLLLAQHEVLGHGGRGREFGLSPSYSFGFFSGATGTARPPRDAQELALLAAGGVEADQVLAHRLLLDALRPEGIDGAQLPLAMMAKLDLAVYVATVPAARPGDDKGDFGYEYRHGNDMALYLVGRQAQRLGAAAGTVWDGSYEPDFDEALLGDTRSDARAAALWDLLDPSLAAAMTAYFRQHVLQGAPRVRVPALALGAARLTLGTRAALGPQEISRFLDVEAATPLGTFDLYVRDLDSSVDRSWGYGAAVRGLRLGPLALSLAADAWDDPRAVEAPAGGGRWNATAEAEARRGRWGVALKVGSKSAGFFPGLPAGDGAYAGAGVLAVW